MPMKWTASFAATATVSACGSAFPMSSEAKRTSRRAMYNGSSPASTILASQYTDASGSLFRIDFERRVLGRRADEHDVAGFDTREEGVLLRLVEAVNLVDEHDRSTAGAPPDAFRLGHHLADLLDPREHGAERHEPRLRHIRN